MTRDNNNRNIEITLGPYPGCLECPIIYSGSLRRYGESSPYANICVLCGGYQRYQCHDNSRELLLRMEELAINPHEGSERETIAMTNLTVCQKQMMKDYADMLQWRIKGLDEGELNRFCVEIGISPRFFITWLRINKTKLFNGSNPNPNPFRYGGDGSGSGGGFVGSG